VLWVLSSALLVGFGGLIATLGAQRPISYGASSLAECEALEAASQALSGSRPHARLPDQDSSPK
jgi:hypothetical protein